MHDHFPDYVFVYIHVIMDDPMAYASDLAPWNLGVRLATFGRNTPSSFTDNLNEMSKGQTQVFVSIISRSINPLCFGLHLTGHIEHMPKKEAIILRHTLFLPPLTHAHEFGD